MGVIKDFHITNFYDAIQPMELRSHMGNVSTINIKFESNKDARFKGMIGQINEKWNLLFP
ncbi:hypothetical protein [Sphingobacterium mizutaii]|uniref:hypothetical protein n=1 Tax=Sphingobacterium mizutaii TaxID=1010 RepID=UPI001628242A|nr:hypothetical protein [Sphingobacterium mizutaii]MBV2227628.1 hypothetical protein [Sphingobacterium mizutaii]